MPIVFRVHPEIVGGLLKRKFTTAFGRLRGDPRRRQEEIHEGHKGARRRERPAGAGWGPDLGRTWEDGMAGQAVTSWRVERLRSRDRFIAPTASRHRLSRSRSDQPLEVLEYVRTSQDLSI